MNDKMNSFMNHDKIKRKKGIEIAAKKGRGSAYLSFMVSAVCLLYIAVTVYLKEEVFTTGIVVMFLIGALFLFSGLSFLKDRCLLTDKEIIFESYFFNSKKTFLVGDLISIKFYLRAETYNHKVDFTFKNNKKFDISLSDIKINMPFYTELLNRVSEDCFIEDSVQRFFMTGEEPEKPII